MCAIFSNNLDFLRVLLSNYKIINRLDKNNCSLLHYALLAGKTKIAKLLIYKGANLYVKNKSGISPINLINKSNYKELKNIIY